MANKRKSENELQELRNAIHTLFTNICFSSPDRPIKSVVITSSVPSEGKSTVAIELAGIMAQTGARVLLVDTDLRRRSLGSALGTHAAKGLYAVITGGALVNEVVVGVPNNPRLFFLDTEPHIPNPVAVLVSKRFKKLFNHLSETFDYVVFDTPPVGAFADAAIISALADATVMVTRMGEVKREELREAYEQLENAGANVIGVCATFCDSLNSSYYYYYSEDGTRSKKRSK